MIKKSIVSCLLLCLTLNAKSDNPPDKEPIHIKIYDKHENPIFGVYIINKTHGYLITTTDIDGECQIYLQIVNSDDSIQFQGMEYETITHAISDLKNIGKITLKELKFELPEAVAKGISIENLLKKAAGKLKKEKKRKTPIYSWQGTALYEKITECRDTIAEYRREIGHYFTSGDTKPWNTWDQNHRSGFVPAYMARSYNMTAGNSDTLTPGYITSENIRFDTGTRKIFTLLRAVQLYGPLFNGTENYEIHALETDSLDYTFTFKTKTTAYPDKVRISCKGTFVIGWEQHQLKSITFDYLDYQLFRQSIMSNQRKTDSPFSTKATLTFAYDEKQNYHIESCRQETCWKHDLGENFLLIEQPSRAFPAENKLIEREAFRCYNYQQIPIDLQTPQIELKIHLTQRYPQGKYDKQLFQSTPPLLNNQKAIRDLSRYIELEKQFHIHDGKAYYPDNYLVDYKANDSHTKQLYHNNLQKTRQQLFSLFPMEKEKKEDKKR